MFYGGLCNTAITVGGFIIAALSFKDITAMAWAWDITLFINAIDSYVILYLLVLKQSLIPLLKSFIYPVLGAICLSLILCLINNNIHFTYILDGVVNFVMSILMLGLTLHLSKIYDVKKLIKSKLV